MTEQQGSEKTIDPIEKLGQDVLDFPDDIPGISKSFVEDALENAPSSAEEEVVLSRALHVRKSAFTGAVATVLYVKLAEELVPILKDREPLMPAIHTAHTNIAPGCLGYANDFYKACLGKLLAINTQVYAEAKEPDGNYHSLLAGFHEAYRSYFTYAAENPEKRSYGSMKAYVRRRSPEECKPKIMMFANTAEMGIERTLNDNARVALEMNLQWGLAHSRGEGIFPHGNELAASYLAHVLMIDRASTISNHAFRPMAHKNPLRRTFHQYQLRRLASPDDLYSGRDPIFTRVDDGAYTFVYPPLQNGPQKTKRACPGARPYRPPESRGQEAVAYLFSRAGEIAGCEIPGVKDGKFAPSAAVLIFGGLVGRETIYPAWPEQKHS